MNGQVYISVRKWTGRVRDIKFSFNSKFGPFDSIYKMIGSYEKKYIKGEHEMTHLQLSGAIYDQFTERHSSLQTEFTEMFSLVSSGLIGTTASIQKLGSYSPTASIIQSEEDILMYLRSKYTLARWFWGKKAALQKLSNERINKYLDADKKSLKDVFNFIGAKFN